MEKLAIIKDVHIGCGDYGKAVLWFATYTSDCVAALQVLDWDRAREIIETNRIGDVNRLEGHPCYVNEEGHTMRFIRLANMS